MAEPLTELNRMVAAGWTPETRRVVAQQCLIASAEAVRAGKPGEAQRLTDIITMLNELDAAAETPMNTDPREPYGRVVRETWVKWAREQPDPKPSWLVGWDELDAGQREVDMRIGEAIAASERQRIYASDNFPGDGSVGPDEIPAEYRQTTAAYWYRRWLWMMNRLDEAPTAWDVYAAKRETRASERQAIRQQLLNIVTEHVHAGPSVVYDWLLVAIRKLDGDADG